jgi:hypothetical protein
VGAMYGLRAESPREGEFGTNLVLYRWGVPIEGNKKPRNRAGLRRRISLKGLRQGYKSIYLAMSISFLRQASSASS